MDAQIPILINGAECGSLRIEKLGLYTEMSADCREINGICRIYAFGEGKSTMIGTMKDGRLRKRFTKLELRAFPECISYAADCEQPRSDDLLWFSAPDGTLRAFDGARCLKAVPAPVDDPRAIIIENSAFFIITEKNMWKKSQHCDNIM